MTLAEMEESMIKDKADRIADLEKDIDEMTGKLVETENKLGQHITQLNKLSKEVCCFISQPETVFVYLFQEYY